MLSVASRPLQVVRCMLSVACCPLQVALRAHREAAVVRRRRDPNIRRADALAQKVRRLRFHGLEVDAHQRKQQGRSPLAEVQEPGYKQNMPDMNAILAVRQLPRLDAFIARRDEITRIYRERLAEVDGILPLADPVWPHRHARHLFVVRVDERACGMESETISCAASATSMVFFALKASVSSNPPR